MKTLRACALLTVADHSGIERGTVSALPVIPLLQGLKVCHVFHAESTVTVLLRLLLYETKEKLQEVLFEDLTVVV